MKTIIDTILNKIGGLSRTRKLFMVHIFILCLSMKGRFNFMNMNRYGDYSEKSYRLHFEKHFDFFAFNGQMIHEHCSSHRIIVTDCSYIPKSGKMTPNIDKFWNGCASKSEKGLEISCLSVVDVESHTAFHLECKQTPAALGDDETRMDFYLQQVVQRKDELKKLADYIVNDGGYARKKYVDGIVDETELDLISRLRKDADLRYLYDGPQKKLGRSRQYDGKINWKNIDKSRFDLCYQDDDVEIYTAVVNSKTFKRNIRIAYVESKHRNAYAILFSTDLNISGDLIYHYYRCRFQIEFLFRDAKQHTGLTHCQSRSENKLHFHFNTSLTAVSLAKAEHLMMNDTAELPFSISDAKTFYFNRLFVDRIFSMLDLDMSCQKNSSVYNESIDFGRMAA